jgi:hypothetical protein
VITFLNSLVLFAPPDTGSNLDPHFPLTGHGSIMLSVLSNDPNDRE